MESARQDKVLEILGEALDTPIEKRGEFLDRACAGDAEIRAAVERLLGVAPAAEAAMPTRHFVEAFAQSFQSPTQIGPYKIIRELGHGGMGAVYLGMQQAPVRRAVAVKLLLPGMDSRDVLTRFESERQALAMMNHPNVAVFFDAGATENGRPYFAMEFVDGAPITQYCDANRLTTDQRIELFLKVCDAVQHAHQKAIIHRDIKPSNVLVSVQDGKPTPKVIDFGIAKATDQRLTERTLFTEHGQLVGTPEYMSPEQASLGGVDIDTRSDVYSLGVLLYELLTGALPFDRKALRESAYDEIRRIIREVDPPRPSTRLSSLGALTSDLAHARQSDPDAHRRLLRGELDWITMRAIEKDRARRYASPAELAADLSRHLRNEPVDAGPPSRIYRARKFVRRHRAPVAAGALVAACLVAGIAATTWQARIATKQRGLAQEQARVATEQRGIAEKRTADIRKLAGTLIFDIDDAIQNAGPTKAREQLVETARKYLDQLEAEAPDDAQQKDLVGGYLKLGNVQYYPGYPHLGQPAEAQKSYAKALAIAQNRFAARPDDSQAHGDVGRCCIYLARAQAGMNRSDLALQTLERAKQVYQLLSKKEPSTWRYERSLAIAIDHASDIYKTRGEATRALDALKQVKEIYERLAAAHPNESVLQRDVMVVRSGLAVFLMNDGLPAEGATHARRSLEIARNLLKQEPKNPQYARDVFNETHMLVHCLVSAGLAAEPVELITPIVADRRKVLAEDSSNYLAIRDVATALRNYGDALHLAGKFNDATAAQEEALRLHEQMRKVDPDDVFFKNETANVHRSLALIYLDAGQLDRALEHAQQAVARHRELSDNPGGVDLSVCNSLRVLAEVMLARGDVKGAIAELREGGAAYAVADGRARPPQERREYVFVLANLGDALRRDNQPEAGAATLKEGLDLADALLKVGGDQPGNQNARDLAIAWWRVRILLSQARLAQDRKDVAAMSAACDQAIEAAAALVTADQTAFHFRQALDASQALRGQAAGSGTSDAAGISHKR